MSVLQSAGGKVLHTFAGLIGMGATLTSDGRLRLTKGNRCHKGFTRQCHSRDMWGLIIYWLLKNPRYSFR